MTFSLAKVIYFTCAYSFIPNPVFFKSYLLPCFSNTMRAVTFHLFIYLLKYS